MTLPAANLRPVISVFALVLALSLSLKAQTTIRVPSDYVSISAAINAAHDGDTVVVSPGTYFENINFGGKAITVTSSNGPQSTIIDGNANGSVVTFSKNETAKSVLNGFTIRNGSSWYAAGGIQIGRSSPTITGNVITGNHSSVGIGITVSGGGPLIRDNVITGNTQIGSSGQGGGGIYTAGDSTTAATPTIVGNTITNNSVANGGDGGGISVGYYGVPTIKNNIIQGNIAYNDGGGIALNGYDGANIVQNIIVGNSSRGGGSGAGIYLAGPAGTQDSVFNNVVAGNTAFDKTSGIYVSGFASTFNISNNVVVVPDGHVGVTCNSSYSPTSASFSHNDVYTPGGMAWSGICDFTSQPNLSADPQFVNASADYHLQSTSPLIDAGDGLLANLPEADVAGNPRIRDGNNDCVSKIDIGAYEFSPGTANANLSPSAVTFPDTLVGTSSSAATVTLTNGGAACFQFSSTQITGDFSQSSTCPVEGVPGGTSCNYSLIFTPAGGGIKGGILSVSGSDGVASSTVTAVLSGNGQTLPLVSLSPSSLSFVDQLINTSSAAQVIVLTNTGSASAIISSISVSGAFSQTNSCGSVLPGNGATCTINVVFTPTQRGPASGAISISDNAAGSPHVVSLSGVGILPAGVSLNPPSLWFAFQQVGTVSTSQSITVTNPGDAALNITGITASGGFLQSNNCPASLAGGATCSITVRFAPVTAGILNGSLTISDNAAGAPQSLVLSGTGVDFGLSVSPANLSILRGHWGTSTVTVFSIGGAFNSVVGLTCTGLPAMAGCSFSPAQVKPGTSGTQARLTLSASPRTPRGTYLILVTGLSSNLSHTVALILNVK